MEKCGQSIEGRRFLLLGKTEHQRVPINSAMASHQLVPSLHLLLQINRTVFNCIVPPVEQNKKLGTIPKSPMRKDGTLLVANVWECIFAKCSRNMLQYAAGICPDQKILLPDLSLRCGLFCHTNLRAIQDLLEKFKLSDRNIQKVFSQLSEYNEIVDGQTT